MSRQSISVPPTADHVQCHRVRQEPSGQGTIPGLHRCTSSHSRVGLWGYQLTMEDTSHAEHSPSPDWFNQAVPLWIRDKMGKRLISIDYCSAPRSAFWLTFTWHQPEHLDAFQVMRVSTEVSRHLHKAICTSRDLHSNGKSVYGGSLGQACLEVGNHTKTQPRHSLPSALTMRNLYLLPYA